MLTSEEHAEVEALVEHYLDRTDLVQHDIKLLKSEPIRSLGYPVPFKVIHYLSFVKKC